MNRIIVILFSLFIFSCAPVSVVVDRYDNNQEKTVAIMKVKKSDGIKDSITIEIQTFYHSGQLKSSTEIENNIPNGKFLGFSISGDIITKGKYVNGLRQGKWEWRGSDGEPDSVITFQMGMLSGKKIIFNNQGTKILSEEYLNNRKNGKSIQYNDSGKKLLIAEYIKNNPNGQWTWFYNNGKKSRIIHYTNGIKNGPVSIWTREGEKVLTGKYFNDLKSDEWKWFNKKGLDSLIQYEKNIYSGKYKIWYRNGNKAIEGNYINGYRTGEWQWNSFKGKPDSLKEYDQGILNGEVVYYYPDGSVKSEMGFVRGKVQGEVKNFYPDGKKKSYYLYTNGVKNGPFMTWNENGLMKQKGTYKIDKLDGIYYRWYNHGEFSSITTYMNGLIHGGMRSYSPSGNIIVEEFYYLNQPQCRLEYHDNGRFKEFRIFDQGEVIYKRKWNKGGLDISDGEVGLNIFTERELYFSGDLKSETSFKGDRKHGLALKFNEDSSLNELSLYNMGKLIFHRQYLSDGDPLDILFPNDDIRVIIKIEEDVK